MNLCLQVNSVSAQYDSLRAGCKKCQVGCGPPYGRFAALPLEVGAAKLITGVTLIDGIEATKLDQIAA
ncbi:MAG: hypothetical protein ACI84R_003361 [Candidatus Azotimanducaceae bacterium]|jgi:hypothetical protein